MRQKLELDSEEYGLVNEYIKSLMLSVKEVTGEVFSIEFTEEEGKQLSEQVKENYTYEGFDINYELTGKGKIYERIIDKLIKLGW